MDKVGVIDDFVRLGGDSITAVKFQSIVSDLNISTEDILNIRTLRDLNGIKNKDETIKKVTPRENYPLTFAERQMATEQGMNPETCEYNVNIGFSISGNLDVKKLENALSSLR